MSFTSPVLSSLPGNVRLVPGYLQFLTAQPLGHVIVLTAPPPVLVGEPVHEGEVGDTEGTDPTKQAGVGQLVPKLEVRGQQSRCGRGIECPSLGEVTPLFLKSKIIF